MDALDLIDANTDDGYLEQMVVESTTKELLDLIEQLAGTRPNKFSTRQNGEQRTLKLLKAYRDERQTVVDDPEDTTDLEQAQWDAETTPDTEYESSTATTAQRRLPRDGLGREGTRARYVREQLLAGRTDYDAIVEECHGLFPRHTTRKQHVLFDRWTLRKHGYDV